ncbi:MAG: beta-glucosidase [Akkermansiaceae bacterium]|jgi:beta-glucosidase
MKRLVQLIAAPLHFILAVALPLHGEEASHEKIDLSFWDEIPASPSTFVPSAIKDGYWQGQFQRVNQELVRSDQAEILFFGDSITLQWSLGPATGKEVWRKNYSRHRPINMGNSGDITPVMLYRALNGNIDFDRGPQPKVAVLLCGTNNFVVKASAGGKVQWGLGADCPPEDVAAGARAVAQVFRRKLPQTRVIMLGILPVANETKWANCQKTNAINAKLTRNPDEVAFLDLQDKFLLADGSINRSLFTDGTHLTEEGYRVLAKGLDPLVSKMMAAKPLDPVKIMLVGGSLTEGRDSEHSYRRYLDGILRRQGHLIDFVGTRRKHDDGKGQPTNHEYDPDHEGHWGKGSAWLAKNISKAVARNTPDLAILHIGATDLVSAGQPPAILPDEILKNIKTMVGALRSENPDVRIVLAKIPPFEKEDDSAARLNGEISRFAEAHSTSQSPIVVADLSAGFVASEDRVRGGVRPTPHGAQKMARIFAKSVDQILSGNKKP